MSMKFLKFIFRKNENAGVCVPDHIERILNKIKDKGANKFGSALVVDAHIPGKYDFGSPSYFVAEVIPSQWKGITYKKEKRRIVSISPSGKEGSKEIICRLSDDAFSLVPFIKNELKAYVRCHKTRAHLGAFLFSHELEGEKVKRKIKLETVLASTKPALVREVILKKNISRVIQRTHIV